MSPFRSKAQIKKFEVLEKEGKLPKGTTSQWVHETKNINRLPEHKRKKK